MFAVRAQEALRALPRLPVAREPSRPPSASKLETQLLRATFDEAWESTRALLGRSAIRAQVDEGRSRSEAPDGAGLPLVPRPLEPLGDRRRGRPPHRLPDLVRPGDGRLQRLGRAAASSEKPESRTVVQVARNLLEGAAVVTRAQQLRTFGRRRSRRRLRLPPPPARLSRSRTSAPSRGPHDPRRRPRTASPSPSSASAPSSPAPRTPPASGATSSPAAT